MVDNDNGRVASDIEIIVLNFLDKNNIVYEFQSSLMGGRFELGGLIADILIPDLQLAWRIHGDYWHRQIGKTGQDIIQRELLEAEGWTVVDLYGSDLLNPETREQTLIKALHGEEMLQ